MTVKIEKANEMTSYFLPRTMEQLEIETHLVVYRKLNHLVFNLSHSKKNPTDRNNALPKSPISKHEIGLLFI